MKLETPDVTGLDEAVRALREWQHDSSPFQLHPGDVGWFWRFGGEATAAAVRTWRRDGRLLAVGLLDEPDLLRLTIAPDARHDEELARHGRTIDAPAAESRDIFWHAVPHPNLSLSATVLAAASWPDPRGLGGTTLTVPPPVTLNILQRELSGWVGANTEVGLLQDVASPLAISAPRMPILGFPATVTVVVVVAVAAVATAANAGPVATKRVPHTTERDLAPARSRSRVL